MSKPKRSASPPDVSVRRSGGLYVFLPCTQKAKAWVEAHLDLEDWQRVGDAFTVEHRFALGLALGMRDGGLRVC